MYGLLVFVLLTSKYAGIGKTHIPLKKRSKMTHKSTFSIESLRKDLSYILKYDEEFSNVRYESTNDVLIYNVKNPIVVGNEIGLGVVLLNSPPLTAAEVAETSDETSS